MPALRAPPEGRGRRRSAIPAAAAARERPQFMFLPAAAAMAIACAPARAVEEPVGWDGGGGANRYGSNVIIWDDDASPAGDDVTFGEVGGTSAGEITTSIIDAGVGPTLTIHSLNFANDATFHRLAIDEGVTLNVAGLVAFGALDNLANCNVSLTGAGRFSIDTAVEDFVVGPGSAFNTPPMSTRVDMSGLATFDASVLRFRVGKYMLDTTATRSHGGDLTLAENSTITTAAGGGVYVGDLGGSAPNPGPESFLRFGAGITSIRTDTFVVGRVKPSGTAMFSKPGVGELILRGAGGGSSRVSTVTVGERTVGASGAVLRGTINLDGYRIDARVDTLNVATGSSGSSGIGGLAGSFILNPGWSGSVVDVNTVNLKTGYGVSSSPSQVATLDIYNGTFRFGAFGTVNAAPGSADVFFRGGTIASNRDAGSAMNLPFNLGAIDATVRFGELNLPARPLHFGGAIRLAGDTTVDTAVRTTFANVVDDDVFTYRIVKRGSSVLRLSAANAYGGGTSIFDGTLVANTLGLGSATGTGDVLVGDGLLGGSGILAGIGRVGGAVTLNVGGTIAPGDPTLADVTGTLTTLASQVWFGGGTYEWQIDDATGAAGAAYDQVVIGGALTLQATAADPVVIRVVTIGANGMPANFDVTRPYTWVVARAGGSNNLNAAHFVLDTTGAEAFADRLRVVTDLPTNTVSVQYQPVPEPGAGLVAVMFATWCGLRRRRRMRERHDATGAVD